MNFNVNIDGLIPNDTNLFEFDHEYKNLSVALIKAPLAAWTWLNNNGHGCVSETIRTKNKQLGILNIHGSFSFLFTLTQLLWTVMWINALRCHRAYQDYTIVILINCHAVILFLDICGYTHKSGLLSALVRTASFCGRNQSMERCRKNLITQP